MTGKSDEVSHRALIELIVDMTWDDINKSMPEERNLKRWIKIPMLLGALSCGMCSSLATFGIKMFGELIQADALKENIGHGILLFSLTPIFGFVLVYSMTNTMYFYQQMEFNPIFSTSVLIGWSSVGTLILREMDDVTRVDIICLTLGVILALVGT